MDSDVALRIAKLRFSVAEALASVETAVGKSIVVTAAMRDIETRANELEESIISASGQNGCVQQPRTKGHDDG